MQELLEPFLSSHSHPQFVALKSLILNPPKFDCLQWYIMLERLFMFLKKKKTFKNSIKEYEYLKSKRKLI